MAEIHLTTRTVREVGAQFPDFLVTLFEPGLEVIQVASESFPGKSSAVYRQFC